MPDAALAAALSVGVVAAVLPLHTTSGHAASPSCESAHPPAPLADRAAIPEVHRGNVDCLYALSVAKGDQAGNYLPSGLVSRAQMASFLARSLDVAGVSLPSAESNAFNDTVGSPHADNIGRLSAADIVKGTGPNSFSPNAPVQRAQVASFLLRAYAFAKSSNVEAFASDRDRYADVLASSVHRRNINGAADLGLIQGRSAASFEPDVATGRAQMGSVLARLLNLIATPPPAQQPPTAEQQPPAQSASGTLQRVNVRPDGSDATVDPYILHPDLSADGRLVAFESFSPQLVPGDTNDTTDVFVRDMVSGKTERISVNSAGEQGISNSTTRPASFEPRISADGRYVAFTSNATNLTEQPDTNKAADAFLHDRVAGTTTLVSRSIDGGVANHASGPDDISADGRWVLFDSIASDLVQNDGNNARDTFLFDRDTGQIERVSVSKSGGDAEVESSRGWDFTGRGALSADGQVAVFSSRGANLVDGDTNGALDVFQRNLGTGQTTRISVSPSGQEAVGHEDGTARFFDATISDDGRLVAFGFAGPLLAGSESSGVYLYDRVNGGLRAAGQGKRVSSPHLSGDGRYLVYEDQSGTLAPDDTNGQIDILREELSNHAITRINLSDSGAQAADLSGEPSISRDGRHVAFYSYGSDLVPGDAERDIDVFLWTAKG